MRTSLSFGGVSDDHLNELSSLVFDGLIKQREQSIRTPLNERATAAAYELWRDFLKEAFKGKTVSWEGWSKQKPQCVREDNGLLEVLYALYVQRVAREEVISTSAALIKTQTRIWVRPLNTFEQAHDRSVGYEERGRVQRVILSDIMLGSPSVNKAPCGRINILKLAARGLKGDVKGLVQKLVTEVIAGADTPA